MGVPVEHSNAWHGGAILVLREGESMEGTVLAGKYALKSKLGQGGMGSVWRADHVQLRSPVAIKLIDQEIARNPEALARFMREAQAAAALRSPHVVQIFDFGADQGVPYIAMELLEGESLAARLERTRILSPSQTSHVISQVTRAIAKAHEAGIVHRDLKPDNVFVVQNDDEEVAKVLDFGIAKASNAFGVSTGSATRTGSLLGTPYYMSPEQAEGNRHVDGRADLWALGVIAYECLVGQRPFEADALGALLLAICTRPLPIPSNHAPVPSGFDAWFARACAREVNERFQTARELALALRRVCGETATPPLGSSEPGLNLGATPSSLSFRGTPPAVERPPTANTYERSVTIEKPGMSRRALFLGVTAALAAIAGVVYFVTKEPAAPASADTTQSAGPVEPAAPSVAAVAGEPTHVPALPSARATVPAAPVEPKVVPETSAPSPNPSQTTRPKAPPAKPRTKPPARATATSKGPAVDLGL
jgi:serine/threonine-protein kinase